MKKVLDKVTSVLGLIVKYTGMAIGILGKVANGAEALAAMLDKAFKDKE